MKVIASVAIAWAILYLFGAYIHVEWDWPQQSLYWDVFARQGALVAFVMFTALGVMIGATF